MGSIHDSEEVCMGAIEVDLTRVEGGVRGRGSRRGSGVRQEQRLRFHLLPYDEEEVTTPNTPVPTDVDVDELIERSDTWRARALAHRAAADAARARDEAASVASCTAQHASEAAHAQTEAAEAGGRAEGRLVEAAPAQAEAGQVQTEAATSQTAAMSAFPEAAEAQTAAARELSAVLRSSHDLHLELLAAGKRQVAALRLLTAVVGLVALAVASLGLTVILGG